MEKPYRDEQQTLDRRMRLVERLAVAALVLYLLLMMAVPLFRHG